MCANSNCHPSFRYELEVWPVRRHGVTMAMLLLTVIALPGVDAGVIDLATLTTSLYTRQAYTPLTNSNIKTAANDWVSDQASASSTYGSVPLWDLSQVTSLESVWCGFASNCGNFKEYTGKQSFNGDISMWDVSEVTTMHSTFGQASAFNRDISKWDVAKVATMISSKSKRILENALP